MEREGVVLSEEGVC